MNHSKFLLVRLVFILSGFAVFSEVHAQRTIPLYPSSVVSRDVLPAAGHGQASAFMAILTLSCKNMSGVKQTVSMTSRKEDLSFRICMSDFAEVGSGWKKEGSWIVADSPTLPNRPPKTFTMSLNPVGADGDSGSLEWKQHCVFMGAGPNCNYTGGEDSALVSDLYKPTAVRAKMCGYAGTYSYQFDFSVAEDRGAVVCSFNSRLTASYGYQERAEPLVIPLNGGRPF